MALEAGTELGSYEIVAPIGAGGMGEVYRARDVKLRRDVAIKVLPAELLGDSDRRARFLREARASAAVNHPNIATIYEVNEADGLTFIAMELVEGETLRALLQRGPLPIPRVLRLSTALTEGLAHAHEKGVIHRDLKPENIIVRPDGHPKILDFGLAKLLEFRPGGEQGEGNGDETVTAAMTQERAILGTPAYMSPEQARGLPLDSRSDVFALGSVLYEMTTGKAPFGGGSALDILGAVVRDKPPAPSAVNGLVPPELDRIIGKCLEKTPDDRYQHTDELAVDLRKLRRDSESGVSGSIGSTSGISFPQSGTFATGGRGATVDLRRLVPLVVITLLVGSGLGWWLTRIASSGGAGAPRPVQSFEIDIGQALPIYDWSIVSQFALSPDGTRIAYVARTGDTRRLYLRRLEDLEATVIPGTENALAPFFSPDGQWIAYYSADSTTGINELKKVPVDGGPPQVLCKAWPPSGGTWLPDGTIVFSSTEPFVDHPVWDGSVKWGLFRVSANGGTPQLLISVDRAAGGEFAYSGPRSLPDGRAVLFTIRKAGGAWAQPGAKGVEPDAKTATAEVALLDLASGKYRTLIKDAHDATYSPTGHILFMRNQALWAAPFDLGRRAVSGADRVVRQNLQEMLSPVSNRPYALDTHGAALFLPAADRAPRERALVWVNRTGGRDRANVPTATQIETPRVSPNGKLILYVAQATTGDIWVHDRSRPGSRMRLTYDQTDDRRPVWFPDSMHFLYMVRRLDNTSPVGYYTKVFSHRADGAGQPSPWPANLPYHAELSIPMVVLADGRTALYQEGGSPQTLWDIAVSSLAPPKRYTVATPALEEDPVLSPDQHWLAYSSLDAGGRQIYVCPYPDTQSSRWQVTSEGGDQPLWSADGSELYFRKGTAMMAVPIQTRPAFHAGEPVKLFDGNYINQDNSQRDYDLEYPKGRRFLMVEDVAGAVPDTRLVLVQNWDQELKKLVPVGGSR